MKKKKLFVNSYLTFDSVDGVMQANGSVKLMTRSITAACRYRISHLAQWVFSLFFALFQNSAASE